MLSPCREQRRRSTRRRRRFAGAVGIVLAVGLTVLALGPSSGADAKDQPARNGPAKSAKKRVRANTVTLQAGTIDVETPAKPVTLDDKTQNAVMTTVTRYVNDGIETSLRTGTAGATLAGVFDDGAKAQLDGADRAVLVDEGIPKPTKQVTVTAQPVILTVLADTSGAIVLVAAGVDLSATTRTAGGPLTVTRKGELLLAPDADGTWKITAYTLHVDRTGPGLAPPTTVKHKHKTKSG